MIFIMKCQSLNGMERWSARGYTRCNLNLTFHIMGSRSRLIKRALVKILLQTKNSDFFTEVIILMVTQLDSNWNLILSELSRWKELVSGEPLLAYPTVPH